MRVLDADGFYGEQQAVLRQMSKIPRVPNT